MAEACVLADGRRVKFSLKRRDRDPFFLVCFQGADGKRKERSTDEGNKRRAADSAITIIKNEYDPHAVSQNLPWDEATKLMVEAMRGQNLRPSSITTYEMVLKTLRAVCPKTYGPAAITSAMAEHYKLTRLKKCRP